MDQPEDVGREKEPEGAPKRGYGNSATENRSAEDFRLVMARLNPFRRNFVEAYLKCDSVAEAARCAGSTAKNPDRVGYNTLQDPDVQKAIALGMFRRIEAAALDSTEVITNLREIHQKAMEEGKFNDAFKATEAMGKMLGLFQDTTFGKKSKELQDNARRGPEKAPDEVKNMMDILSHAKTREGTSEDPRFAPEGIPEKKSHLSLVAEQQDDEE